MNTIIRVFVALSAFALLGCGKDEPVLTPEEEELVARSATAMLFSRPLDIVDIERREGGVIYTSYVRPNDGSVWRNRFRIEGEQVAWGSAEGRWRDDPADETLRYELDRARGIVIMTLRYSDGSSETKEFTLNDKKG